MIKMKEGFYCLSPYIYYGLYPKNHVSGFIRLPFAKPEHLKTNKSFSSDTTAVTLHNNHALTEQEQKNMEQALNKLMIVLKLDKKNQLIFQQYKKN